ncbi:MAG: hypothetical protein HOP08_12975 [Cyclobacteriaceae bacterium]|nr:hypothetical protein [Cyclobacteriaceae bacterium]
MKKILSLIAIIALGATLTFAQKKGKGAVVEKRESDKFKVEKSKILFDMKRLALAQLTVTYKLTTTAKTIAQAKGGNRDIAGARVSAYMEFTDGDMTQKEYQEITDYFYYYLQKQFKSIGIDTVSWNNITAHDFYLKVDESEDNKDFKEEKGGGQEWVTVTALGGKQLHQGMTGFAFGKGKRAIDFSKDLDAVAAFFKLTVDFADVMVNLDIKSVAAQDLGNGWYRPASSKKKYTWAINPEMRVGNTEKTFTLFSTKKGGLEFLMMWNDIESHTKYAESMTEDVSKARSGVAKQFAFRKELTPVLIQTTRDKYKTAAKKAMETYADALVEKIKMGEK